MPRHHWYVFLASASAQLAASPQAVAQNAPSVTPAAAASPVEPAPAAAPAPAGEPTPAPPAPGPCNPNEPGDICVPAPYTQAELSEIYDFNASNQFGGSGQLTAKGIEWLQRDCPRLCSQYQATYKVGRLVTTYSANGVSFQCPCALSQPGAAHAPVAPTTSQPTAESAPSEATPSVEQPAESPASKTFFGSIFSTRLELGVGGPFGDIVSAEEDSQVSAVYGDGTVKTDTPSHTAMHIGANLEISPLRTDNLKLALRAGYLYTHVGQEATVGGGQYEMKKWDGQLLRAHAALIGPVLYLGKRWYGSFQLLAGPVTGTLHPVPIGQQINGISVPDVDFSGWMLRLGPGFGYSFKTLLLGGDVLYSRSSISLKQVVYSNFGKDTGLHTVGINLYVGVHL